MRINVVKCPVCGSYFEEDLMVCKCGYEETNGKVKDAERKQEQKKYSRGNK